MEAFLEGSTQVSKAGLRGGAGETDVRIPGRTQTPNRNEVSAQRESLLFALQKEREGAC